MAAALTSSGDAALRYELGAELARGGMGVIHLARDVLALRDVAYKRLLRGDPASHARSVALFQREYDTLARLPHPNIVEVYDYGFDADGPYYTMELLSGQDIAKLAPLPVREVCRLVRDVASALALLHTRKLIHRDVSPGNVRLTGDGRAKLIDFGALTSFGRARELVGTPAFIAPECLSDAALDQRVDLYALGALAYWMLTRQRAVRARDLDDLVAAWASPVARPSELVSDVPPELDELVLSLLSHEPLARPASAAYVIDRLTAIAELSPEVEERRVAYSYFAHPSLIGRDSTLLAVDAMLQSALRGHGCTIAIEAPSGCGRTALLQHVETQAQLAGATVLRVDGGGQVGPFSLAQQLARGTQWSHAAPPRESQLSARPEESAAGPEPLVRSMADAADRHERLLSGILASLTSASDRGPLVILVDDVQRADVESVSVLVALSEQVATRPLCLLTTALVAAHTSSEAHDKLRAGSARFDLAPLDEASTLGLAQGLFGDVPNVASVGVFLHGHTGGNPAQCMDLARLLLQRNIVRYTLGTFTLPHEVSASLLADADQPTQRAQLELSRLTDLSIDATRLAELLCLHEGLLTVSELCHAARLPTAQVVRSLEELTTRGVVLGSIGSYTFGSSSLRAALSAALAEPQRVLLHAALADAQLAEAGPRDLRQRLAASQHLLAAQRSDEAVDLIEDVARQHRYDLDVLPKSARLLETALAARRRQGRTDIECLDLLVPIVRVGIYGELGVMMRHVHPTLGALSKLCGLTLAMRLRPWLGATLALTLAIVLTLVRRLFSTSLRRAGSLRDLLSDFLTVASSAVGAAACAFDAPEARKVNAWLRPLDVLPLDSAGGISRAFCDGTVELAAGAFGRASERFDRILPALAKPVKGLDEISRMAMYEGSLNAKALVLAIEADPQALELADRMDRGSPLFRTLAEGVRLTYHARRGELDLAEGHRAVGQRLALRAGSSWSAASLLTANMTYGYAFARDALGLMRIAPEFERLAQTVPRLALYVPLCAACLHHLRGRHAEALQVFEGFIDAPDSRELSTARANQLLFGQALLEAGELVRAKQVAGRALADAAAVGHSGSIHVHQSALLLAQVELALGNLSVARAVLDAQLVSVQHSDNPLAHGGVHRAYAELALRLDDAVLFELHFAAMRAAFHRTRTSSLIAQCDALLVEAIRRGLRASASPNPAGAAAVPEEPDFETVTVSLSTPRHDA